MRQSRYCRFSVLYTFQSALPHEMRPLVCKSLVYHVKSPWLRGPPADRTGFAGSGGTANDNCLLLLGCGPPALSRLALGSRVCAGIEAESPPPSGRLMPTVFPGLRTPMAPLASARTGKPESCAVAPLSATDRITLAAATSRSRTRPHSQRCTRSASVFGVIAPQPGQVCDV